jgi:ABC-2 type transport system ATP-binding protein
MNMRELLLAQNLTKKFKSNLALSDLNLTVCESEIVCLLGANGAGKTTTINLFLGFLKPTSGKAFVDGLEVSENLNEVRAKLAYVPEQVSLYPSLTGLENLDYFVKLSLDNTLGKADLQNLLDRVGLNETAASKRVNGYS